MEKIPYRNGQWLEVIETPDGADIHLLSHQNFVQPHTKVSLTKEMALTVGEELYKLGGGILHPAPAPLAWPTTPNSPQSSTEEVEE
jgi:hypothetical protein